MAYTPRWESLSAAAERLLQANGCSQDQARWDLCRALSDRVIDVRAKLERHDIRPLKSTMIVSGNQLEIPTVLKPDDIDWQNSRPLKPWFLCDVPPLHHGPWHLAHIELSSSDVTAKVLSGVEPTASPSAAKSAKRPKKTRENPKRKAAKIAINELWPKRVPPAHELPNDLLDQQVNNWLTQHHMPEVSRETVLRAAGRRK